MSGFSDRVLAALPGRMPGRLVGAVAAELGAPVADVQAVLLALEVTGGVLRKGRYGSQHWYRGIPPAVAAPAVVDPGELALFDYGCQP